MILQWVASSADTAPTTLLRRRDERSVRERVILNLLMLSAHWYCWALLSRARLRWCVEECMTDSLHCRCLSVCISDDLFMTERACLSLSACLWHWPTTAVDNYNNFSMISYWMGKREHEKSIGRNDVKCIIIGIVAAGRFVCMILWMSANTALKYELSSVEVVTHCVIAITWLRVRMPEKVLVSLELGWRFYLNEWASPAKSRDSTLLKLMVFKYLLNYDSFVCAGYLFCPF